MCSSKRCVRATPTAVNHQRRAMCYILCLQVFSLPASEFATGCGVGHSNGTAYIVYMPVLAEIHRLAEISSFSLKLRLLRRPALALCSSLDST
jgi:hypothetical protein